MNFNQLVETGLGDVEEWSFKDVGIWLSKISMKEY